MLILAIGNWGKQNQLEARVSLPVLPPTFKCWTTRYSVPYAMGPKFVQT